MVLDNKNKNNQSIAVCKIFLILILTQAQQTSCLKHAGSKSLSILQLLIPHFLHPFEKGVLPQLKARLVPKRNANRWSEYIQLLLISLFFSAKQRLYSLTFNLKWPLMIIIICTFCNKCVQFYFCSIKMKIDGYNIQEIKKSFYILTIFILNVSR